MTNNPSNDANNSVVAIYDSHNSAESAIKKLAEADIPMNKLSVIGKGYHSEEKVVGFYNTGERMKVWGKFGAFWGGLWVLLAGGFYLMLPVTGPVFVLGYLGALVLTALEGAVVVGGLGALGGALFSLGIPKDSILQYENAIKTDGFLIVLNGTQEETERARAILKDTRARQIDMHARQNKSMNQNTISHLKAAG